MYSTAKYILKLLLPQKLLFAAEPFFRKIGAVVYLGSQYECRVCATTLSNFVELPNHDLLCPACGSISRNRRLWQILETEFLPKASAILDFSPSRNLYRKMKKLKSVHYTSSDISGDFIADKKFDITKIETQDQVYDLIICFHILEHIENDRKAMAELYRVLKTGGTCLIQTPFKEPPCYEDPNIRDPAERKKHFGQEDHVRIYSIEELQKRLTESGFQVTVLQFQEPPGNRFGYSQQETILVAQK